MSATTAPKVHRDAAPIYQVSVDAFLYGCAAMLALLAVDELTLSALFSGTAPEHLPEWTQILGPIVLFGSFVIGALSALLVHGRSLRKGRTWLGMLLGLVGGVAVLAIGYFALRLIPTPFAEDSGPWGLVIGVVVLVLAFVVPGLVSAVRDLVGRRAQQRVDWLRLAATAVALAIVVASLVIGGETAEAGLFAVLFAGGPAAFAALGGALGDRPVTPTPA